MFVMLHCLSQTSQRLSQTTNHTCPTEKNIVKIAAWRTISDRCDTIEISQKWSLRNFFTVLNYWTTENRAVNVTPWPAGRVKVIYGELTYGEVNA